MLLPIYAYFTDANFFEDSAVELAATFISSYLLSLYRRLEVLLSKGKRQNKSTATKITEGQMKGLYKTVHISDMQDLQVKFFLFFVLGKKNSFAKIVNGLSVLKVFQLANGDILFS